MAIDFSKVNGIPTLTLSSGEVISLESPSIASDPSTNQVVVSEYGNPEYFISLSKPITVGGVAFNGTAAELATKVRDEVFVSGGFALPPLTQGSVVFSDGTTLAQDNAKLFWDNTNKRLGIGVTGAGVTHSLTLLGGTGTIRVGFNASNSMDIGYITGASRIQSNRPLLIEAVVNGYSIGLNPHSTGGVAINKGTTAPELSSMLEIVSTNRGFLPPRMTSAQRTAIANPAVGLMVYQTDGTEGVYVNTSTGWKQLSMV